MMLRRRSKVLSLLVLTFFCVFMIDTSIAFAKSPPYPKYAKIPFKIDRAKIKVKRVNKQIIPLEIKIKNKTFKFVKQDGKYGIRLKTRDMVNLSPEFKDKLGTSVVRLGLHRVRDLVKGDRIKAKKIIDQQKLINKRSSFGADIKNSMAQLMEGILSLFTPSEAIAQERSSLEHSGDTVSINTESEMVLAAASAGVDRQFLNEMNTSYNKVLNSQSFFYPQVQPGIGGWDVVSEEDEEDEDDEESWYDAILGMVLIAVVLLAPIAATIWLCAQALTVASVLTAFAGSVGAVTGTSIITETLGTIGDLLTGKPLIEIINETEPYYGPTGYY